MNKILLIIQREYLSRVKKKSFIIMTFLVPFLFIGMYGLIGYLFMKRDALSEVKKVVVVDETGNYINKFKNSAALSFTYQEGDADKLRKKFEASEKDYFLHIPSDKDNVLLLSQKKPSVSVISEIENQMNEINREKQLTDAGVDIKLLHADKTSLRLITLQLTENGNEEEASSWLAYGIGFAGAFLIYMSLFIYGVQVMRGVIEEKTNRIIEVVISSVKPFQLMLGKIIGVGMVGLTQFLLWIVLSLTVAGTAGSYILNDSNVEKLTKEESVNVINNTGNNSGTEVLTALSSVPLAYTLGTFLFYFLFGFLLYSSIFAAVGSAVDNETETQQFMLPITMPLIFTFILSINFVINDPDSSLSFWLSIIPFTSPIAMMIRIPFGVPPEELVLSMILLLGGFILITWIAARIYRVGILMYGKKTSYRELAKWFMYKE